MFNLIHIVFPPLATHQTGKNSKSYTSKSITLSPNPSKKPPYSPPRFSSPLLHLLPPQPPPHQSQGPSSNPFFIKDKKTPQEHGGIHLLVRLQLLHPHARLLGAEHHLAVPAPQRHARRRVYGMSAPRGGFEESLL